MTKIDLSDIYRGYIACLNKQDWPKLEQFVHDEVCRNGQQIGLSGYCKMLEKDFSEIPDLHYNIQLLISDPPYIASRLSFDSADRQLPIPFNEGVAEKRNLVRPIGQCFSAESDHSRPVPRQQKESA
jgi:predicted ester cyclase